MDLSGFKIFDIRRSKPYFSITENGVTFSKGTTEALELAEYVVVYKNDSEKKIALKNVAKGDKNAKRFYQAGRFNNVKSVRWNNEVLNAYIEKAIGHKVKGSYGFRVYGFSDEGGVVVFDLTKAKPIGRE